MWISHGTFVRFLYFRIPKEEKLNIEGKKKRTHKLMKTIPQLTGANSNRNLTRSPLECQLLQLISAHIRESLLLLTINYEIIGHCSQSKPKVKLKTSFGMQFFFFFFLKRRFDVGNFVQLLNNSIAVFSRSSKVWVTFLVIVTRK